MFSIWTVPSVKCCEGHKKEQSVVRVVYLLFTQLLGNYKCILKEFQKEPFYTKSAVIIHYIQDIIICTIILGEI